MSTIFEGVGLKPNLSVITLMFLLIATLIKIILLYSYSCCCILCK